MKKNNKGLLDITPVILTGGYGTRLWPLSRRSYPKQFCNILKNESLFQQTINRFKSTDTIIFKNCITLTNNKFRFIVKDQIEEVKNEIGSILIEPEAKNTASPILAACFFALKISENPILIVAPSDHIIPDTSAFHDLILKGLPETQLGKIVTFGVKPTKPETGYGYLELFDSKQKQTSKVKKFVEKPSLKNAKFMLNSNKYLWNSGIFMFQAKDMITEFEKLEPDIYDNVKNSLEFGEVDLDFFRLDPSSWKKTKNISIDYAIMERSKNLVSVPFKEHWSDLGGWDAIWAEKKKQKNSGLAISGTSTAIDCKNSLLHSDSDKQHLVGLGLDNIIAVAMPDAVLVAHKNKAQDVKKVVEKLKKKNIFQSENFKKDYRPWGWFEELTLAHGYQVKKILVKPGASLSLQSHKYRSEHWVVVKGTAKVTINSNISLIKAGQSIYVPQGAIHRMENTKKTNMILIEVQTGSYLGEDDIIRYEDIYNRKS